MNSTEQLALDAYTYYFPLVFNIQQMKRYMAEGVEGDGGVGYNAFSHASRLADADSSFVSVNNDTIYSLAIINLSAGPLLLSLPDSGGIYYGGQLIDAWTNNFAYVGSRATDGVQKNVYLVPPDFKETLPENNERIEFPTTVGVIIMRYAINGIQDLPRVQQLQKETKLTPLDPRASLTSIPEPYDNYAELPFFNEALAYRNAYPAPLSDQQTIEQAFEPLGLFNYDTLPQEARSALKKANDNGVSYLRDLLKRASSTKSFRNGWDMNLHAFDYNDTFFELGTIQKDLFIINDRHEAVTTRALSAIGALWGNNAYEAAYFMLWEDDQKRPLVGSKTYELTFETPLPVNAFWSMTMYDMPEFYLVKNPIDRYSIGDRTEGLVYNDDGTLTITFSKDEPTDTKRQANWLPTPNGQFRPMLRLYLPKDCVFEPSFTLPPMIEIK